MGRRQSCLLLCNPLRWTAIYYLFKQLTEELMLFQKVPKTHDSGVVRVSDVQRQPSKKAHRRNFIKRISMVGPLMLYQCACSECETWLTTDTVFFLSLL